MSRVVVGILSRKNGAGDDEYLLVSSEKESFGEHSGAYYPPGGHVEEGETEAGALVREIREELALDVVPVQKIVETAGDMTGQITCWWECRLMGGELSPDRAELADAGFFSRQHMKNMNLWPATRRFFDTHIFR